MGVAMAKKTHHHHDRHHECGFRRFCAGRALQVPRAILRARLRIFRDRKLGRVAILSQFLTCLSLLLGRPTCLSSVVRSLVQPG